MWPWRWWQAPWVCAYSWRHPRHASVEFKWGPKMGATLSAFSEDHVERLTGVSKAQLRYWDRTDFFSPTFDGEQWDSSLMRVYSFKDVASLRVLNRLRNKEGVSLHHLREVKQLLHLHGESAWSGVRLFVFDKRVAWVDPTSGHPQEMVSGQFVVTEVVLDDILADLRQAVASLNVRAKQNIGRVEQVRSVSQHANVIAGTRIRVKDILSFQRVGYSVDQILEEYPDLTREDVLGALKFSGLQAA